MSEFEPHWRYHATQPARLVQSIEEAAIYAPSAGWWPSPTEAFERSSVSGGLTDVLLDVDDPPAVVDSVPDTRTTRAVGRVPLQRKR